MDASADPLEAGSAFTTGAVARRFGVAPTTLRSWESRYGIGPATRDSGRHRRWTAADLAVLEHMQRLTNSGVPPAEAARSALTTARKSPAPAAQPAVRTAAPPPFADPADALHRRRGLSRAATRLDAPAVQDLVTAAIDDYGLAGAWNDVLMPTLHAVGRKRETEGEPYVEVEHLLSWHVSSSLRRAVLDAPVRRPATDIALLACVPGEEHTLALEALTAVLAGRGLAVRMFGAAVPPQALEEADMTAIGGRLLADTGPGLDVMVIDVAVMDGDWRQEVRTAVIERLLAALADACGLAKPSRAWWVNFRVIDEGSWGSSGGVLSVLSLLESGVFTEEKAKAVRTALGA
ncbi:MerR family transcriptional regulator [Streptomyces monticola]|uniref:MerR family transcriptional regulator n=1 Tax=Streptomyces monticola TaxID=2666263 RepID=A0ABW2JAA7_9ACTN